MFKLTFYVLICLSMVSCSLGPVSALRFALDIMDKYVHKNERSIDKKKGEKKPVKQESESEEEDEEHEDE
ncbi:MULTISPECIES: hypothetical protein [unclassified Borrelia]|uniref:hypothetical protein n=1 Tax=unclassified Borrelia TaxID=2649934 RepID=UPI001E35F5A8|nr:MULTISPECIES: hypothetical protein [unclassified Borrelia]UGQ16829.1 hypothetical protein LSO06_05765 [Borrelia sp. RT5S]UGQ17949.1 hypothetical protein LSO05_05815 [Borrelia sp. RT1S]